MSSALAAADAPQHDHVSFEGRVFQSSPFGTTGTSAVVFGLAASSFLLVAGLAHYHLVAASGLLLDRVIPGVALSLLLATALGMSRYADLGLESDATAFRAIVSSKAAAVLQPVSSARRLAASLVGAGVGAVIADLAIPAALLHAYPAVFAWQTALNIVLCVLFARGAVMASRNWRRLRSVIVNGLRIDLLHTDRLAVIGRQSARGALTWFTNAAVICLFFIGGDAGVTTVPILIGCTGIGVWIFLHPMAGVHHRIRAAKALELGRVRDAIGQVSAEEARDPVAAARLPGLIAYEARIQAVREWPFDQSTLIRVAAYLLIPAIPWFGEAAVSTLVQRLAH
jgi:hypothetical protein